MNFINEASETNLSTPFIFEGGRQGGKQYQEDSYCKIISSKNKVIIGCVFDGHAGYNGKLASNTARDTTLSFFESKKDECEKWTEDEWKSNLEKLFDNIHDAIRVCLIEDNSSRFIDETTPHRVVRSFNSEHINGGTTGTIVVDIHNDDGSSTVISAHVGDSSAMIIYPDGYMDKKFELLFEDHAPENEKEYKRIQELSPDEYPQKMLFVFDKLTEMKRYLMPPVFPTDPKLQKDPWGNKLHPANVRYEPATYCVSPKGVRDESCIAVSRALGDFYAHQYGITYKPEIIFHRYPTGTKKAIVVASDGVWDCWKWNEFADYFISKVFQSDASAGGSYAHIIASMERVLVETVDRAIENFGIKHFDDATMVSWF